jgi:hypothetical protein
MVGKRTVELFGDPMGLTPGTQISWFIRQFNMNNPGTALFWLESPFSAPFSKSP